MLGIWTIVDTRFRQFEIPRIAPGLGASFRGNGEKEIMKLYHFPGAPNPRRVRIFAEEKGIELELVHCDILHGEQKTEAFLKKNRSGKIPVLELSDGRCIPEAVSICRYLEALHPEPNLFGGNDFERAYIDARERQIELEFWREVGVSWVNGPTIAKLGLRRQIVEAKQASDENVRSYYDRLDSEFSNSEFVAGDRFSVADITLLVAIDFATHFVELAPEDGLRNLGRWRNEVSNRPSVLATANPSVLEARLPKD